MGQPIGASVADTAPIVSRLADTVKTANTYTLTFPGPDKVLGTADDMKIEGSVSGP